MTFSSRLITELRKDPVPILSRGYRAKERIADRQERIEQWRQIAESITANPEHSGGGGGGPSNKVETCVLRIVELEEAILDEINEIKSLELENSRIIEEFVHDPNYKRLLELRYLNYKLWEEIAVSMGYTFRWTQELHSRALKHLKENAIKTATEEESALIPESAAV